MPTTFMQEELAWHGMTAANLEFAWVMGEYLKGRQLTLLAGREPRVNQPELVLSETVARQLTDTPVALIGQKITLNTRISGDQYTVTGIVRSSLWRSEDDPDAGGYRVVDPAQPGLSELDAGVLRHATPRLTVVFQHAPTAATVAALEQYVASNLPGLFLIDEQAEQTASADRQAIARRVQQRSVSLPLLAALLGGSGLVSLGTVLLAGLLRRRALLGVDLALGATRRRLRWTLVWTTLWPALLGTTLGTALVTRVPVVLPEVLTGQPPAQVLALAWTLPNFTLLLLSLLVSGGVLRDSAFGLLRGVRPGQFVRPLLGLMVFSFVLALGGLLSALGVKEKLDAQTTRIRNDFSRVLEVTTTGDPENRTGAGLSRTSRRITVADLDWFRRLDDVASASAAERLNPNFQILGKTVPIDRPVAGDDLIDVLGIRVLSGTEGGCLLSRTQSVRLGIHVGGVIGVPTATGVLPCPVSGITADPDDLKRFVMQNFPALLVPARLGLKGRQDSTGRATGHELTVTGLTTTNVLLRLRHDVSPETVRALHRQIQQKFPGMSFALRPYAPNIDVLLGRLRNQQLLFLALAALGSVMTFTGLLGSFVAYLDARRYRIALDRAQGMSVNRLRAGWLAAGSGLGATGAGLALVTAATLTPALYNAFSLDAPVGMSRELLPSAALALPGSLTLTVAAIVIVLLGLVLATLGDRWLSRQSLTALLKLGD
nr:ABC transporter permease [Deinococcus sedimenti]